MEHTLHVAIGSEAEKRLLFLFNETHSEYHKIEVGETIHGDYINVYMFSDDVYERIKQYLEDEGQ